MKGEAEQPATIGAGVRLTPGEPLPLGMHRSGEGHNFAIFSRHATAISLLLFAADGEDPCAEFRLNPDVHRTGEIWHAGLVGATGDMTYAVRADGPFDPARGHRFDPGRLLLDPHARQVVEQPDGSARARIEEHRFDWQGDRRPHRPWSETVIYEVHVRGFTRDPSSGVAERGCYRGIIAKIPHLQRLGVTAVELMPIQYFPRQAPAAPAGAAPRVNFWGYDPVCFLAPHPGYATADAGGELKALVRALHAAGIEVILDVVFNHTAEGDAAGPTLSLRGIDNAIYYLLDPGTGAYVDFTGCGNTVDCSRPVVHSLILAALRHWVIHYHVDGFRFDLATVLGRGADGTLLQNPPLLEQIAEDPILRDVKLIAEAWDLGGANEVGHFPGVRWAEWNSAFRDDVRRFWRGDPGMTGAFATRLCGSEDLFGDNGESPLNSINLVTSHDGFTLSDLVSYARKHNEANGEANRDGPAENYSENNGREGPSDDPAIEAMRERQVRNFLVTLMLSRGVPMLLAGDECRRTQGGNSNAWCQDNETSWFDWRKVGSEAALVDFVAALIAFRTAHPVLGAQRFYAADEIAWIGLGGAAPRWHGPDNAIGCVIGPAEPPGPGRLALLFNATLDPQSFLLPANAGGWQVAFDTSAGELPGNGRAVGEGAVELPPRSTLVLTSVA